jgi:hypothetical protein
MRTLNANGAALQTRILAGDAGATRIVLLHIAFTVAQRWALAGSAVSWSSETWSARDIVLSNIQSEQGDLSHIQITSPGVTDSERALAFEDSEGAACNVYFAWFDKDGATTGTPGTVGDALLMWAGELDQPGWTTGLGETNAIHFTAESRASIALHPSVSRYSNDEQQRLFSGDTSLDFDPRADGGPKPWPSADFYKV